MNEGPKIIRPGILVSRKTRIIGGVEYQRREIDSHRDGAAQVDEWQTRKVVRDKEEHERATQVRNACSGKVRGVCADTGFGWVCRDDDTAELADAIAWARQHAAEFNSTAKTCAVEVTFLTARFASDEAQAVAAITGELAGLLQSMESGIRAGDVKAVRDAAKAALQTGKLLDDTQVEGIDAAVAQARAAATKVAREIREKGEIAAEELRAIDLEKVRTARFAFLDLSGESCDKPGDEDDTQEAAEEPVAPAIKTQRFAGLEI